MELTEQAKKDILNFVLRCVTTIADKEYQKRIWIRGEGPECDSFYDVVCDFLGDCNPVLEHCKDFGIIEGQYRALKKFRDQFEAFSDENDWPPEFIDTLEWAKIISMAKEVLKAFNYERSP